MNNFSSAFAYLRARRRFVLFVLLLSAVVGAGVALLMPNKYIARAAFYSEGKSSTDLSMMGGSLGGLGALMALAGGSMGGSQTGFFVDLLKSQAFLDSLATSVLPIGPNGSPMTVRAYVVKKAKNEAQHRWKARVALKKMIEVAREPSGIVVVGIEAKSPVAAAAIANRAVDVIDALNLRFRRDQAAARRRFTEAFRTDVERRLSTSEYELQNFLSSNRSQLSMRTSSLNPVLQSREDRLRAEVTRLRALKDQLESTIETARLTEFNDAPVISRIDNAPPPEKRSGPPRMLITLGTVLLAITALFWTAFLRTPRTPTS
jgi:uncharacterized protein involved in exopolysaccharide biosynthesis